MFPLQELVSHNEHCKSVLAGDTPSGLEAIKALFNLPYGNDLPLVFAQTLSITEQQQGKPVLLNQMVPSDR